MYLVDARGEPVHTWTSDLPSAGAVALLDSGHLLRAVAVPTAPFHGGGVGGRLQELDGDGRVVWDFELATERYLQHHDFEPMPYGTVLVMAWERKSAEEALTAGRDPERIRAGALWSEVVVEIEPEPPSSGRIVWEWHAWDHLIQDQFPERANHGNVAEHPELLDLNAGAPDAAEDGPDPKELAEMAALGYGASEGRSPPRTSQGPDWLHANAIAYDPESERILVSSRALSEVWVLDHSTTVAEAAGHAGGTYGHGGDLLDRFGNPQSHGAGGEDDRWLFHPHDAHWIPYGQPGYGNVVLFNNGPRGEAPVSEVLEFRMGSAEGEETPRPGRHEIAWSCTLLGGEPFFSRLLSGAQRLPNGNTLVTIGGEARLVETTPQCDVVWEYTHVARPEDRIGPENVPRPAAEPEDPNVETPRHRVTIFRATRYPLDHPGVVRLLAADGAKEK